MLSQIKSAIGWLRRQPRFLFILFLLIGLPIGAYHGYQTTRALIIDGFLASNVRSFLVSPSEKQTYAPNKRGPRQIINCLTTGSGLSVKF